MEREDSPVVPSSATGEGRLLTAVEFGQLGLAKALMKGLAEAGFTHCTPIQAETLPLALRGEDVAGQAQTGTGKTAAFLLALMDRLLRRPAPPGRRSNQPRALVVAPTRELAVQIHKDALLLGRHAGLRFVVVYGGEDYERQRREVQQGADVLIGTPGRLIDYYKQRAYDLKAVEVAVIDEADRMFDLGFIRDIRYLLKRMPPAERRLNMLFSATLSWRVMELAYEHMNNPRRVVVEPEQVTAERVREVAYFPANEEKIPLLVGLLRRLRPERAIVFVNTRSAAEKVQAWLEANGVRAGTLSGDVPQKRRLKLLQRFQQGELPVLVATDVAARGLHIPGVTHVFNFDLPQDPEDYVHRVGRTARAGASGDAISFVCETYAFSMPEIEAYIGHKIPHEPITDELLPRLRRPGRRRDGEARRGDGARQAAGRAEGGGRKEARKGDRKDKTRAEAPAYPASQEAVPPAGEGAPGKRRRRRRRRRARGGRGGEAGAPPAASTSVPTPPSTSSGG